MSMPKLGVQEQMVPGDSLEIKFGTAVDCGYDFIELRGGPNFKLRSRLPDLRRAKKAGVVMSTVCVEMTHFIGAADPALRRDAVENLKSMLDIAAEIEDNAVVVTPAEWGIATHRLPPMHPMGRTPLGDRNILLDSLGVLSDHAARVRARIALEPLNRYENHLVNTMGQAASYCEAMGDQRESRRREALGNPAGIGIVLDTFHANIEEHNKGNAIVHNARWLHHVQLGDSTRGQPGTGELDWSTIFGALQQIDYRGGMALECRLINTEGALIDPIISPAEATVALKGSAEFLRSEWAAVAHLA